MKQKKARNEYRKVRTKHSEYIYRMKSNNWDDEESSLMRSESIGNADDEDDETCGIFCFGLGLILMFVGVAILATLIVYNQSDQSSRHVVSLTSTRKMRPVSEELTKVLNAPSSLVAITDMKSPKVKEKLSLLVVIHSLPESQRLRVAARETWIRLGEKLLDTVVLFSIPAKGLSEMALAALKEESQANKDMVIFPQSNSVPESELLLFEWVWATKMYNFHYVLKVRNTTYVNLPVLMTDIVKKLKERNSNAYFGYFEGNRDPKESGKLSEPDWFLCDRFIRFAHSGGYIVSQVLVRRLLRQAKYLHPYNNEDVALGTWLSPFNDVDWIHETRFDTDIGNTRGCKNSNIVFQVDSTTDMVITHHRFMQNGVYCEKEYESIPTYRYNFDTLPSSCCTPL